MQRESSPAANPDLERQRFIELIEKIKQSIISAKTRTDLSPMFRDQLVQSEFLTLLHTLRSRPEYRDCKSIQIDHNLALFDNGGTAQLIKAEQYGKVFTYADMNTLLGIK